MVDLYYRLISLIETSRLRLLSLLSAFRWLVVHTDFACEAIGKIWKNDDLTHKTMGFHGF